MRSGWNGSKSSSFSPVPAKRIGLPMTSFTDSAAPPRASPSILVRITPSRPTVSSNASATLTASWPVMASTTRSVLCGWTASRTCAQLVHQVVVDLQTAGGVDDDDVCARAGPPRRCPCRGHRRPGRTARRRRGRRCARRAPAAARRRPGAAGRRRRAAACWPCVLNQRASLPACGGLARALEAGEQHDRRRLRAHRELAGGAAEGLDELLVDDLDDLLRRASALLRQLGAGRRAP